MKTTASTIALDRDLHVPGMPSLFISHGAPTFALIPGETGPELTALGRRIARPQAILLMSPHWRSETLCLSGHPRPPTVHDFAGFPAPLYSLEYPAPGAPALARSIALDLTSKGFPTTIDPRRGLDHGAWIPLRYLYPEADVPVVQLSMPETLTTEDAHALGTALRDWRRRGVLIVGSGGLTHNLYEFRGNAGAEVAAYAREFAEWVQAAVHARDHGRIAGALRLAPHAHRAHPTSEHYLPLPFAAGAAGDHVAAETIADDFTYGVLSMHAFLFDTSAADRLLAAP